MPAIPTNPRVIGIVGVRDYAGELYDNQAYVWTTLSAHLHMHELGMPDVTIVTGGGKGVDTCVGAWAEAMSVPCRRIPPNIQEFGPERAFIVRNNNIVAASDELVVFWDGCMSLISHSLATAALQHKVATIYPVI